MAQTNRHIIVIGASAGGVPALQRIVASLPADLPASVLIVLHMWSEGRSYLASILSRAGNLPAVEAVDGAILERRMIYVAPVNRHLAVADGTLSVVSGPRENRARPAINPLFRSAAAAHRNAVIGVILSGTLDDGAAGLWAIKQCGGIAIVQADAKFDQMPRSAIENVAVDHYVPLDDIPSLLNRLSREMVEVSDSPVVPRVIQVNNGGAKTKSAEIDLDAIGKRTVFSCPECNGALWELSEGVLEYRCAVGHAYSADTLRDAQNETVEQSLWGALRALKESAALDQRRADRSAQQDLDKAAARYRQSASHKMEHAAHLQEFLATFRTE